MKVTSNEACALGCFIVPVVVFSLALIVGMIVRGV